MIVPLRLSSFPIWEKEIEKRKPRSSAFFAFYSTLGNLLPYFFIILSLALSLPSKPQVKYILIINKLRNFVNFQF